MSFLNTYSSMDVVIGEARICCKVTKGRVSWILPGGIIVGTQAEARQAAIQLDKEIRKLK